MADPSSYNLTEYLYAVRDSFPRPSMCDCFVWRSLTRLSLVPKFKIELLESADEMVWALIWSLETEDLTNALMDSLFSSRRRMILDLRVSICPFKLLLIILENLLIYFANIFTRTRPQPMVKIIKRKQKSKIFLFSKI